MAASPEKRCLYEILGLQLDCTADEIRSAYKKLALQRHPDKLMRSGLSQAEATASFQELVNAYEVLSDPRERAWYDSHRSQILFSNLNPSNSSTSIPNLFSFFSNSVFSGFSDTGKGFYKVYGDIFDKIYQNDLNFANKLGLGAIKEAPIMGNLNSPYSQVNAFYGYWLGFATVMDFVWVDEYDTMAGPDRRSRRKMEEENKKLRKKAKREYNETVRGLAAFAKKRDKRVIDMQVKRNEEMERKKEEERKRKKELEREKEERARAYKEQEWAKVEEMEDEFEEEVVEGEKKEFYCVACGKKFKSEKQWRNHEQSKKHKEKVAELREAFEDEETENEDGNEEGEENEVEGNGFVSAEEGMDELMEKFENGVEIQEQENGSDDDEDDDEEAQGESSEEEVFADIDDGGELKGVAEKLGLDDDDASMLEAMLSGHKSRKNKKGKTKASSMEVPVEVDGDEMEFMEYNDRKGTRRNRGSRRQKGRRADDEAVRGDATEIISQAEENRADEGAIKGDAVKVSSLSEEKNGHVDSSLAEETTSSHSFVENEAKGKDEDLSVKSHKVSKPAVDKKGATKKDIDTKSMTTSKGRKQKASSKTSSDNICEKCGADFKSRTKLHKHLKDTGHATLKSS